MTTWTAQPARPLLARPLLARPLLARVMTALRIAIDPPRGRVPGMPLRLASPRPELAERGVRWFRAPY